MSEPTMFLFIVFAIGGVLLVSAVLVFGVHCFRTRNCSCKTAGMIVDFVLRTVIETDENGHQYERSYQSPLVAFTLGSKVYEVEPSVAPFLLHHGIGDYVSVRYNPANPANMYIDGTDSTQFFWKLLVFISLFFLVPGFIILAKMSSA